MRDVFQKALDLLRGLAERVEHLKASRARRLELLRTLWSEAIELCESGTDASRAGRAASRILELCSEMGRHVDSNPRGPEETGTGLCASSRHRRWSGASVRPVLRSLSGEHVYGKFLKDYKSSSW